MNVIVDRLKDMFSWDRISHYLVDELLPDLVLALLVFLFFYSLWRVLRKVTGLALSQSSLDETARQFIQTVLKLVVLSIGLVSTLAQIGVDTTGLIASLGVVGLTIGFAARDTLSNIISGLFIFWDRPFVVGDLVEVAGHYGKVKEITMRSTRVVTVDGRMLAIPNTTIVNTTVASYTNFPHLRLDVALTVGVDEDLTRIRTLLLGIVEQDDRYLDSPAPAVVVKEVNDYNVAVELRAWISEEREHVKLRFELRERMFEVLRGAGVDLPFETLALRPLQVATTSLASAPS